MLGFQSHCSAQHTGNSCLGQILQGGSSSLEGDNVCTFIKATAKLLQHFQGLPLSQDRQPGGLNTQINDTKVVWAIPTGTLNSPGLICLFRSERSQFRWNLGRVFQSKGQPGSFSHVTLSVNYNWWGICYSLGHFLLSSSFLKNFTVSPTILIQVIGSITKERKAPNPRKPSRWQIMNLFVWEVSSQKPFFEETAGVCKETSRCRWSFKVHEHQCGKGSTPVGRTYQQRK